MTRHSSDPDFQVLHVMAVRGLVPRATLDAAVGAEAASERVRQLVQDGMVKELSGRVEGYTLTKGGARAPRRAAGDRQVRRQAALDKVRDGDLDWMAKPTIDSYHAVWFELHEALLQSQGLEREAGN
ncbi:MAG: hypothetical protein JOZ07_15350 [Solirubrobacterales bacterium]|nr:hypothetical protein [Solirubrobacterales bacterium]